MQIILSISNHIRTMKDDSVGAVSKKPNKSILVIGIILFCVGASVLGVITIAGLYGLPPVFPMINDKNGGYETLVTITAISGLVGLIGLVILFIGLGIYIKTKRQQKSSSRI